MSDVLAALNRDHANITKLLELLESEILAIEVGKTPDYPLLQDIMRYLTCYPDRFHHPKEELIFAQLLKREPGVRAEVKDLSAEHVSIVADALNFAKLLRPSGVDSVELREHLGASGTAYIRALREHISREEGKLFALAKIIFTEEEWQVIDEEADSIEDPLFGPLIADEYQRLYRLIVDQADLDAATGR